MTTERLGGEERKRGRTRRRWSVLPLQGPGHLIANFPAMKLKSSRLKKPHKKSAMKATRDDSKSKSEEEADITYMCFMAQSDGTNKVT